MATNYPDVVPGEPISFSAQRENDMRHLLNSMNGMSSGAISGGVGKQTRLKVYNNSSSEILPAGAAVTFADGAIIDEAVPAVKYQSGAIAYGVLENSLDPGEFGVAVISGPVNVEIQGGSGKFAVPTSDGKKFTAGASGAQILSKHENRAVILLGGSGVKDEYKGYFALEIIEQTDEDKNNDQLRVRVYDSLKNSPYCGFAEINGKTFRFDNEILLVSRAIPYIVLRYDADSNVADIRAVSSIYSDTPRYHDYIIGELVFDEKDAKVVQRHRNGNGVIKIWITTATCLWEEQNVY